MEGLGVGLAMWEFGFFEEVFWSFGSEDLGIKCLSALACWSRIWGIQHLRPRTRVNTILSEQREEFWVAWASFRRFAWGLPTNPK